MNSDRIEGNWKEMKGKVQQKWCKPHLPQALASDMHGLPSAVCSLAERPTTLLPNSKPVCL